MLAAVKQQLLTNWHPMRWVALGISLILGFNWLVNSAPVSGFIALFFLFQAVTNTGCLAGQCAPARHQMSDENEEITYEEIKK
ncbi:MAG: hypothetical protein JJU37_12365 [Balneolaceae bacterium]|nr:hypothetical protein [Balneolaceae bacterium]